MDVDVAHRCTDRRRAAYKQRCWRDVFGTREIIPCQPVPPLPKPPTTNQPVPFLDPPSGKSGFPPTSKWERGLSDVDCEEEAEEEEDGDDETGHWVGGGGRTGGSWGLTEEAMAWLCQEGEHPALVEVSSEGLGVQRMPAGVYVL